MRRIAFHIKLRQMNLLQKYSILSLLCIGLLAFILRLVISHYLTKNMLEMDALMTANIVRKEMKEHLGLMDFKHPDIWKDKKFEAALKEVLGLPEVFRVKVWDKNGAIIWSEERRLIGKAFPENELFQKAMKGEVVVKIEEPKRKEHIYERQMDRIGEVYVPIYSEDNTEIIGVVETYKVPKILFHNIMRAKIFVSVSTVSVGIILYLSLFYIVKGSYRAQVKLEEEKQDMQRQLFQSSKLASLGELSAGIAHEINSPINGIINYAQLIMDDIDKEDDRGDLLRGIIEEGNRISKIVKDLLTFARQEEGEASCIQIPEVIDACISLLRSQLMKDNIKLIREYSQDLPMIRGIRNQLQQVFINLITNSWQALEGENSYLKEEKIIKIEVEELIREGRYFIRIKFYDNGIGISPSIKGRIFDPFFTTKRGKNGGTGLGLSVSYGIIKAHNGEINVDSIEGKYTLFTIHLPAE